MNDPVTGINVASSPSDCITKNTMMPTKEKLMRVPAGPARCNALPEPTSRPGPMMPPIAIIWMWRDLRRRCRGAENASVLESTVEVESSSTLAWVMDSFWSAMLLEVLTRLGSDLG